MSTRALRAGFSLAEALVVTALVGVLTTVVGHLLISEFKFCTMASERLGLEREQELLRESLRQDILASASAGLTFEPNSLGLALQPVEDITFEGTAIYSDKRLNVYLFDSNLKRLERRSWQTTPPITLKNPPARLNASDWNLVRAATPQRRIGWSMLVSFRVRSEAASLDLVSQRLWFDCKWQDKKGVQQLSYCFFTRQNP
ncbi:hypothetical protein JST97_37405 [bacterium]|nr:hypothetical protein [bacterium]